VLHAIPASCRQLSIHCPACTVPCCWPPLLHRFPFCKPRLVAERFACLISLPLSPACIVALPLKTSPFCLYLRVYMHHGHFIPVFPRQSLRQTRDGDSRPDQGAMKNDGTTAPLGRFLPALLRHHLPLISPAGRIIP